MCRTVLGLLLLGCSLLLSDGLPRNLNDYREGIVPRSAKFPERLKPRIIGGEKASIEEYPFAVSLQNNGTFFGHDVEHFCAGSIIGENWIITSAQCALRGRVQRFHVRAGSKHYHEHGQVYNVEDIIVHPRFDNVTNDYDFGLVKVAEGIKYDSSKQPIRLARERIRIEDGSLVRVAGWGARMLLGPVSEELRQTGMTKISREACERLYNADLLTERMFCLISNKSSPCIGDSGAAAVFGHLLYGVTSWSRSCANEYPTAYAAVAQVTDWIDKVTGASSLEN